MIENNGIINSGNNNINLVNSYIDFDKVLEELKTLENNCHDDVSEAMKAAKEKNPKKLIKALNILKKGTISLISGLGLTALERVIENFILK